MAPLEIARLVLLVTHFVGLAAIIGPYIFQMRRSGPLDYTTMLVGSIVQVVSGVGLIATRKLQDLPVIDEKMLVKLVIALVVLGVVIAAIVVSRRLRRAGSTNESTRPLLISAGVLAIANVVVAAVWS